MLFVEAELRSYFVNRLPYKRGLNGGWKLIFAESSVLYVPCRSVEERLDCKKCRNEMNCEGLFTLLQLLHSVQFC